MCGIAGIVNKKKCADVAQLIYQMSHSIKHRGPDGEGFVFFNNTLATPIFTDDTPKVNIKNLQLKFNPHIYYKDYLANIDVAFAHRRLSITDTSQTGHQPSCNHPEKYWITFNGEIYNYLNLKSELEQLGHQFVTHTESEVLLNAYKNWGKSFVKKLNGMFAFAIYDTNNNQLFMARDVAGVKPFYFVNNTNWFAFASEYKALIKPKIIPFEINYQQQMEFIINASFETSNESLFKHIQELKPGHYAYYNLNTDEYQTESYFNLNQITPTNFSTQQNIEFVEQTLIESIKQRLNVQQKLNVCLSGGLDSAIIACIIKYLNPSYHLTAFTSSFPGETIDEYDNAKQTALHCGATLQRVQPNAKGFFEEVETLNYQQDLPIWGTSTYAQYLVNKEAASMGTKILMNGQGADELFAGYHHHFYSYWNESFKIKNFLDAQKTLSNPLLHYTKQKIKQFVYIKNNHQKLFNTNVSNLSFEANKLQASLNNQLQLDFNGKLKQYLKCEDRCSMAFGIESRVPFSDDIPLINLLFSISGDQKIQQGTLKYLLREATKRYIPTTIYNNTKKIGFEAPMYQWLQPNQFEMLDTIITHLDFVNSNYMKNHFNNLLKSQTNLIFRLYSLAVWKNVFSK